MSIQLSDWTPAIRHLDTGEVHVAIGDVHGRADLLEELQDALQLMLQRLAPARAIVVYLGDLIDKGPESRRALDLARRGLEGAQNHLLLGNHEDRLLRLLEGEDAPAFSHWMQHGGRSFLDEFGVSDLEEWRERVRDGLDTTTITWLRKRPVMLKFSRLVYVHAGIDERTRISTQRREDLLWIREPWTESSGPYEDNLAFIHGHTPISRVDIENNHRINLDTGAVETGILSALVIHEDRMRLVQTIPA